LPVFEKYYGKGLMPIISGIVFRAVHWAVRRGAVYAKKIAQTKKKDDTLARRTGIRGETHGYLVFAQSRRRICPREPKAKLIW
jgi:hypothetical protein